jgi:hypothetical protein
MLVTGDAPQSYYLGTSRNPSYAPLIDHAYALSLLCLKQFKQSLTLLIRTNLFDNNARLGQQQYSLSKRSDHKMTFLDDMLTGMKPNQKLWSFVDFFYNNRLLALLTLSAIPKTHQTEPKIMSPSMQTEVH